MSDDGTAGRGDDLEDDGPAAVHAALFDALELVDLPALEALLDERFVIEHPTGLVQSREEWLADIDEARKEYHEIDHVESALSGGAAHPVLTSRTITEATIGRLHATWRLQLTSRLVRRDEGWVITRTVVTSW
ncbi:hypothetical protein C5C24_10370 [Rathayibacter sp. AY2B3]|jgi:hypothetical protein|uniref:nuclear transport factor 2 family protein n=1 Tax=unclassified Rathayibacter TaxID=2609250 RepID=UPI000CE82035|nr:MULTISPECIES: nuclear transport factor 2 family protein [unclassified Rathayibacter]PPG50240.1 hypothetical protein C5C24_10370 [Rathayibacter sp. AY2B3]PPI24223.1 hypothetical protein C5D08_03230 [Rathayibacter sp. AY1B6]PPI36689.1 hypothetical protein C5D34_05475 [Rathayibacter sp. AY1B1]